MTRPGFPAGQSAQAAGTSYCVKDLRCEANISLSDRREGCESHQVILSRVWHTRQGVSAAGGFMSRYPLRLMNRFEIFASVFSNDERNI